MKPSKLYEKDYLILSNDEANEKADYLKSVETIPSFNKDTHAFRQRKSALTASSSLTYASMPASSSLSSSGFLSPKSPAEFLRGRNGARGSAER